jgi:hypothetical protein
MAYNVTYTADDLAAAVPSGVAKGFIVAGSFAGLVVLVFLYGWAKKKGVLKSG